MLIWSSSSNRTASSFTESARGEANNPRRQTRTRIRNIRGNERGREDRNLFFAFCARSRKLFCRVVRGCPCSASSPFAADVFVPRSQRKQFLQSPSGLTNGLVAFRKTEAHE